MYGVGSTVGGINPILCAKAGICSPQPAQPDITFNDVVDFSAGFGDVALALATFGVSDGVEYRSVTGVGSVDPTSTAYGLGYWSAVIASVGAARALARPPSYYPPNRGFAGTPVGTTLAPGTRIDRYGSELGTFASPAGTPFGARSLPAEAASAPLRAYEVLRPLPAQSGPAAPWFGQVGGGTQLEFCAIYRATCPARLPAEGAVNTSELEARLRQEGLRPDVYSISGPLPSYEGLVLSRTDEGWKIEHFERGMRRELESFASEEQACERMYELLRTHFQW